PRRLPAPDNSKKRCRAKDRLLLPPLMGLLQNRLTWGDLFSGQPAACSIGSGGGEGLPSGRPGSAVSSSPGYAAVAAGEPCGVAGDRGGAAAGHQGVSRAAQDGRGGGGGL